MDTFGGGSTGRGAACERRQQRLKRRPLPHGHGSLRFTPTREDGRGAVGWNRGESFRTCVEATVCGWRAVEATALTYGGSDRWHQRPDLTRDCLHADADADGDADAGADARVSRAVLAETGTPDGVRVVLFADTWQDHIVASAGHAELTPHLDAVLATVAAPDYRESDQREGRERFFKHDAGPSLWLLVVVDFGEEPARIVTALGYRHGRAPTGWIP